jgi:AAHS family 4-hydroxybenzoate transporter-like MFS transporter
MLDDWWQRRHTWLITLTALAIVFDGIDNQLLGIVIPNVMREWSLPRSAFAPVISIGLIGMMIGGATAGLAGDRFGRRTALLSSMTLFGVMTAASAMAADPMQLTILRVLAAAGLGGAIPNATALAAEYVPPRHRPVAVTLTIVCVPLGGTIAGLLGAQLLPLVGWRSLFLIGGTVPVLYAAALTRLLPESPRDLEHRPGRWSELARSVAQMREWRGDTLALFGAFFSCLFAVYLAFSWLPALLTGAGFDSATASGGITAFNLGGIVGALAASVVISRLGSRGPMVTMAAGATAAAVTLGAMRIDPSQSIGPILAMITLVGGLINAVQVAMYALAAHVYPGAVRATGVGMAASVGRVGAILSGYAGAWAMDLGGSTSYFGVMAGAMIVTTVALALVTRHVPRPGPSLANR